MYIKGEKIMEEKNSKTSQLCRPSVIRWAASYGKSQKIKLQTDLDLSQEEALKLLNETAGLTAPNAPALAVWLKNGLHIVVGQISEYDFTENKKHGLRLFTKVGKQDLAIRYPWTFIRTPQPPQSETGSTFVPVCMYCQHYMRGCMGPREQKFSCCVSVPELSPYLFISRGRPKDGSFELDRTIKLGKAAFPYAERVKIEELSPVAELSDIPPEDYHEYIPLRNHPQSHRKMLLVYGYMDEPYNFLSHNKHLLRPQPSFVYIPSQERFHPSLEQQHAIYDNIVTIVTRIIRECKYKDIFCGDTGLCINGCNCECTVPPRCPGAHLIVCAEVGKRIIGKIGVEHSKEIGLLNMPVPSRVTRCEGKFDASRTLASITYTTRKLIRTVSQFQHSATAVGALAYATAYKAFMRAYGRETIIDCPAETYTILPQASVQCFRDYSKHKIEPSLPTSSLAPQVPIYLQPASGKDILLQDYLWNVPTPLSGTNTSVDMFATHIPMYDEFRCPSTAQRTALAWGIWGLITEFHELVCKQYNIDHTDMKHISRVCTYYLYGAFKWATIV